MSFLVRIPSLSVINFFADVCNLLVYPLDAADATCICQRNKQQNKQWSLRLHAELCKVPRQCRLCGRVVLADGYPVGKTHKALQQTWRHDNTITIIKLSAAWQPIIYRKNRGFVYVNCSFFCVCFGGKFTHPVGRWRGRGQSRFGWKPTETSHTRKHKLFHTLVTCHSSLYMLHRTTRLHGHVHVSAQT